MAKEYLQNGFPQYPIEIEGRESYPTVFDINRISLTKTLFNMKESFASQRLEIIGGTDIDHPVSTMDSFRKYDKAGEQVVRLHTVVINYAFEQRFKGKDNATIYQKDAFVKEYVGKSLAKMYGKLSVPGDGIIEFGSTVIPPVILITKVNQLGPEFCCGTTILAGIVGHAAYKELEDAWSTFYMKRHWKDIAQSISYNPNNSLKL